MGVLTWLAVSAIGAIGFGVTGPIAGSIAAATQSIVYGGAVTSGSLFATLQAFAMVIPLP